MRVFWWPGPHGPGGLLERHWNPTHLYYAAQAWQTAVDGPSSPVSVQVDDGARLRWEDGRGRRYRVWWRSGGDTVSLTEDSVVDEGYRIIDPYHARLLSGTNSGAHPAAPWPIIARKK